MKVKDLHKVLAKIDPELEVWINEKDGGGVMGKFFIGSFENRLQQKIHIELRGWQS